MDNITRLVIFVLIALASMQAIRCENGDETVKTSNDSSEVSTSSSSSTSVSYSSNSEDNAAKDKVHRFSHSNFKRMSKEKVCHDGVCKEIYNDDIEESEDCKDGVCIKKEKKPRTGKNSGLVEISTSEMPVSTNEMLPSPVLRGTEGDAFSSHLHDASFFDQDNEEGADELDNFRDAFSGTSPLFSLFSSLFREKNPEANVDDDGKEYHTVTTFDGEGHPTSTQIVSGKEGSTMSVTAGKKPSTSVESRLAKKSMITSSSSQVVKKNNQILSLKESTSTVIVNGKKKKIDVSSMSSVQDDALDDVEASIVNSDSPEKKSPTIVKVFKEYNNGKLSERIETTTGLSESQIRERLRGLFSAFPKASSLFPEFSEKVESDEPLSQDIVNGES